MQKLFSELTKELKMLLFDINSLYLENDKNEIQTTYAFQDKYLKPRNNSIDSLESNLNILEKLGYIKPQTSGLICPTALGLSYNEARLIYWRHRVLIPAAVSFAVSLILNIIFRIIDGRLYW